LLPRRLGDVRVVRLERGRPLTKTYPVLPIWDRLAILAGAITQFLVGHGRIWSKPFDWDRSILLSYATIAVLVALALLLRRRLQFLAWCVHTLELVGIKFIFTASILLVMLIVLHPKPSPPPPSKATEVTAMRPSPSPRPPTVIPEAMRTDIEGQVTRGGSGISGVLVFVSGGLEGLVFAAPDTAFRLENDGTQFTPRLGAVQTGQTFVVRSANRELHTLLMTKPDRSWVFNIPMLASGADRSLKFDDPKGLVTLHCTVHGKREGEARLAILNHPFFSLTEAGGRFRIHGVPKMAESLTAYEPGGAEGAIRLSLKDLPLARVALSLP